MVKLIFYTLTKKRYFFRGFN